MRKTEEAFYDLSRVRALTLLLAFTIGALSGCGTGPRETLNKPLGEDMWLIEEPQIYVAALDSLKAEKSVQWHVGDSVTDFRVLSTVHWWPLVSAKNTLPSPLGPIPLAFQHVAAQRRLHFHVVDWPDAIRATGELIPGPPLVILGPIDFLSSDEALLRANLYLGPNGQGVYVFFVRRINTSWKAVAIRAGVQA